jgi:hypothetical protein
MDIPDHSPHELRAIPRGEGYVSILDVKNVRDVPSGDADVLTFRHSEHATRDPIDECVERRSRGEPTGEQLSVDPPRRRVVRRAQPLTTCGTDGYAAFRSFHRANEK